MFLHPHTWRGILSVPFSNPLWGEYAWEKFPQQRSHISDVLQSHMFGLEDAPWVARSAGICLRITVEEGTYMRLKTQKPSIEKDALYGDRNGQIGAHVLFSWQALNDGSQREVGHFDVLFPKQGPVALLLSPDAALSCSSVCLCRSIVCFHFKSAQGQLSIRILFKYIYISVCVCENSLRLGGACWFDPLEWFECAPHTGREMFLWRNWTKTS